jgi:glycosyltransferase involved in cell wall biosynthesis
MELIQTEKKEITQDSENNLNPLVSIIVITYNSSKYVLETLESAKAQTYKNIELIITDDCSTDDTVEICRKWIIENSDRFVRTELLTADKNTGIAPNCNRGIHVATGVWMKTVAGDDLLLANCIDTNVKFAKVPGNDFLFSKFHVLSKDELIKEEIEMRYESNYHLFKGNQFDNLMNVAYYFPTITIFANINKFKELGLYNENYPFHEDLPMWFKILKNGYQFVFIEEYTVDYRVYNNSTYNNDKKIINLQWHKSTKKFYYGECFEEMVKRKQYLKVWDKVIIFIYYDLCLITTNKKGMINNFCKLILGLSPLYLISKLKKQ